MNGDIRCRRTPAGLPVVEGVRHKLAVHSPMGFEWGYPGSGPADLALNILAEFTGDSAWALANYQEFKDEFVAPLPRSGGVIGASAVEAWIAARRPSGPAGGYAGGMPQEGTMLLDCRTAAEVGRALAAGHAASCPPEVAAECGAPEPGDPQCAELEDVLDSEPPPEHWQ